MIATRRLLTTAINTRVLVLETCIFFLVPLPPRKGREGLSMGGSPPWNSFLQHVCDSVVPRKSVVGPPFPPSFSSPLPPSSPSVALRAHLAINRHHCHLQRRISIFSIRPNLIEAVHRVRERINNAAVRYMCARRWHLRRRRYRNSIRDTRRLRRLLATTVETSVLWQS